MSSKKYQVLVQTNIALIMASLTSAIGVQLNYKMGIASLIVGIIACIGCVIGIRFVNYAFIRKLLLWFVASFLGLAMSAKLIGVDASSVVLAVIATSGLVSVAGTYYDRFSINSLALVAVTGLIGVILLGIFGITGSWVSVIGAIVFFVAIMYDFKTIDVCKNAEEGPMNLMISIINLFSNMVDLTD